MPAVARGVGMVRGPPKANPQVAVRVDFSDHEDLVDTRSHFRLLDRW
ncbi:hypothetical protein J2X19_002953 [Rhodoferax ferrireducens]|uniref:Uncharacterized protein n=1 Tax=Rhodoferax ferrireducens TaxID=192843 RepID=A0ABU2CAF0_9BURK|nr:hypothetical protein [Rhodoferax ferrireducens]MDR7378274.1 hypothetical protein [Rhodoferax ferrireducens]